MPLAWARFCWVSGSGQPVRSCRLETPGVLFPHTGSLLRLFIPAVLSLDTQPLHPPV
jgi:hypothetical protein